MSPFFTIAGVTCDEASAQAFARFGLSSNPFPVSDLHTGIMYVEHARREFAQIDQWITNVEAATEFGRNITGSVRPVSICGSVGVGKHHLLNSLEHGLNRNALTPVLRKSFADDGMTRCTLAELITRCLPVSDDEQVLGGGLVRRLIDAARDPSTELSLRAAVVESSPLHTPFWAAVRSNRTDALRTLTRWVRRESTTAAQRAVLGLSGVLNSEGEAIRVVADLIRLAHAARLLQTWFVFIDQLDGLWRPHVITPTRRARFLTDLRHLIDEALEGAPTRFLSPGTPRSVRVSRPCWTMTMMCGTSWRRVIEHFHNVWARQ